ncbi:CHAT domain-containing protein [Suillus spraguei]|nr:CHAT domain-containing protein [Suillus spraguei]
MEYPVHVPLDTTQAEVSELSSEFQSLTEEFGSSHYQLKLISILHELLNDIIDPVVQALGESNVPCGSCIWWCPTAEFTLLPLYVAGPYEKKKHDLSHFYIFSYTPTLVILIHGNLVEGKELKCVAPELVIVAEHLKPVVSSFTSLEDSKATVQGTLNTLNHNQWLHLACHGMPNWTQLFESSFAMQDGPLMIKDIIQTNWQNPEFAFLLACHTTVGDKERPNELIHLAAAMQFCRFCSVIGSMWSVDDEVACQVVSDFYSHLIDDSGRLDSTCAAVVLHKAVKVLHKMIPLEQHIVFVHIGV